MLSYNIILDVTGPNDMSGTSPESAQLLSSETSIHVTPHVSYTTAAWLFQLIALPCRPCRLAVLQSACPVTAGARLATGAHTATAWPMPSWPDVGRS